MQSHALARGRINRLSLQLANQIAAGEVVERPASVVKELMENALDADSTSIIVDIVQGGLNLIRVRDNGNGIDKEDMHLAVSRHATSKLNSLTELENVTSLGFRGEALASISSVSRLSLHSKSITQDSKSWCIDTGNESDFANYKAELIPSSLPQGSMLEVRDLFFNTPARRKFLRTEKTEFRYIEDVFRRIALSFFNVSFQLSHNRKLVKKLPAIKNEAGKLQRVQKLFGDEFCQAAIAVDFSSQELPEIGAMHLWGWVAGAGYLRHQPNQQYFYVNGRFVRDKLLNHALRQVFQDLIPSDMYAAYVLYLQIAPQQVDVNVHPTKHEVRFRHSRMVHDFIISALNQAISEQPVIPNYSRDEQATIDMHTSNQSNFSNYSVNPKPSQTQVRDNLAGLENLYHVDKSYTPTPAAVFDSDLNNASQSELVSNFPKGEPLGIIAKRFLLADVDSNLWLIDLDKCLPSINTQRLLEHYNKAVDRQDIRTEKSQINIQTQRLLIPESISLKPSQLTLLQNWQDLLKRYGIIFTLTGPDSIMLRQIPQLPFKVKITSMLENVLGYLMTISSDASTQSGVDCDEKQIVRHLSQPVDRSISITRDQQFLILKLLQEQSNNSTFSQSYRCLGNRDLEKLLLTH